MTLAQYIGNSPLLAVIPLGGEIAVVVPLHEYRMLAALRERASAAEIEEAEIEAAIAEHEAWKAAGRPCGAISHEVGCP